MCNEVSRDEFEALVDEVESLKNELEEERERRREAEQERDELRDRVDDLEGGPQLEWGSNDFQEARLVSAEGTVFPLGPALKNKVSQTDLEKQLDDLRDRLADGDLAEANGDVDEQQDQEDYRETPLEDVVALPEYVADTQLSPNQQRARFIAKDVVDYGEAAMGGRRVLKAGRVGRVLKAGMEVEAHPETVSRVMEILADLANDQGQQRKRHGEKRVVLEGDLVERLERVDAETHNRVSQETA